MELQVSRRSKFFCLAMVILMVLGIFASTATSVYAAEEIKNTTLIKENNEQEIANELEFIFDKASSEKDGVVTVNESMLAQRYGKDVGAAISEGIKTLYDEEKLAYFEKNSVNETSGIKFRNAWTDCMIENIKDFVGINAITAVISGGLNGLKGMLARKAFKEIANLFVKAAVGSSVATIIATLGYYSVKCAA